MHVSITELIGQAHFQTGSGNSEAGRISSHRLFTSKQDMDMFALPTPSTRCQQSVVCQNASSWLRTLLLISPAFHDSVDKNESSVWNVIGYI